MLGDIRSLQLDGTKLHPEVTIGAVPAELGLKRENCREQAQNCTEDRNSPLPVQLPSPHAASLTLL